MNFKSDNITKVHPKIMEFLAAIDHSSDSYGVDSLTFKAKETLCTFFDVDADIYFVSTGTVSNALALSACCSSYGLIYAHKEAHIATEEASAASFFTGGASIIGCEGMHGRIDHNFLKHSIKNALGLQPHMGKPSVLSITQATEAGTVYTKKELEDLISIAKEYGLYTHMDGARLSNTLVAPHMNPNDIKKLGIDVLSFGATKNGCMLGEAIIFFNKSIAKDFSYKQKQAGQLTSKMRYLSAQFIPYIQENIWQENALHANKMAAKLVELFNNRKDYHFYYPTMTNELFILMDKAKAIHLQQKGIGFYEWPVSDLLDETKGVYRFVTSFTTNDQDIKNLETILAQDD